MSAVMSQTVQPTARTARAQAYKELKVWLRTLPAAERVKFLTELAQHNERFSLRLTRSAQLSQAALVKVLRHSLTGDHSNAPLIIKCFEPLLGKRQFWRIVARNLEPNSLMFQSLDQHGGNELTRRSKTAAGRPAAPYLSPYVLASLVAILVLVFAAATAPAWCMASLAAYASNGKVRLENTDGGFWKGRAAYLNYTFEDGTGRRMENFTWDLLPSRLIRGEVAARVTLADSGGTVDGIVGWRGTRTFISDLQASFAAALVRDAVPLLDVWKAGGTVRVSAERVGLNPTQVIEPATVHWMGATLTLSPVAPLADYQLRVTPDGDKLNLKLQTTSGALQVNGSGQYVLQAGGEFRGRAQAATGFADQLQPLLQLMGPVNGDGSVDFLVKLPPLP